MSPGFHQKAIGVIQNPVQFFAKRGDISSIVASTISLPSTSSTACSLGSVTSSTGINTNDKNLLHMN